MSQYIVGLFQMRKPFLPVCKQVRIRHSAVVSNFSENQKNKCSIFLPSLFRPIIKS